MAHAQLPRVAVQVEAGHKVGIVRQVETAALKSVSDTRNKVFERHVTSVFTRATLDAGGLEGLAAAAGVEAAAGDAAAEEDGPPVRQACRPQMQHRQMWPLAPTPTRPHTP